MTVDARVLVAWLLPALAPALAAQGDEAQLAAEIAAPERWQRREVGDGVWLKQRRFDALFAGPQSLTVLDVRLDGGRTRLDVAAPGRLTPTSAMGTAAGALAAINGGFFERDGTARGLLRLDGVLQSPARAGQASVGIAADGRLSLVPRPAGDWPEVHDALGAGPMLLRGGKIVDHGERQRDVRHPRSAIGTTADGRLLCLAVDGRTPPAAGMSFEETARVLQALGCRDALNLDGGGSTTLWVAGLGVCNFPCDDRVYDRAGERAVANALLLHAAAVVVVDDDDAELLGDGWRQQRDRAMGHGPDVAVVTAARSEHRAVFVVGLPFAGRWRAAAWLPGGVDAGPWHVTLGDRPEVTRQGEVGSWGAIDEFEAPADRSVRVVVRGATGASLVVDAVRFVQVR